MISRRRHQPLLPARPPRASATSLVEAAIARTGREDEDVVVAQRALTDLPASAGSAEPGRTTLWAARSATSQCRGVGADRVVHRDALETPVASQPRALHADVRDRATSRLDHHRDGGDLGIHWPTEVAARPGRPRRACRRPPSRLSTCAARHWRRSAATRRPAVRS